MNTLQVYSGCVSVQFNIAVPQHEEADMIRLSNAILGSCLFLAACSDGSSSPTTIVANTPTNVPPVTSIPNLTSGPHLGYIVGFDALNAQQTANADARFSEAVAAGMRISRVQLGWDELETARGVFDQNLLTSVLGEATVAGQQPFFSLSTLDTSVLTIPSDLLTSDGSTLATGLTIDGPEITARFQVFLDWLIPELLAYNIWGLAIANEPSTLFETISQQEITNFLISGVDHANALTSQIAITVTIAGGADNNPETIGFISDLIPYLDIASFNFYCLASDTLQTTNQAAWQDAVDTFVLRAQNRPIFFQELGCPAGWGDLGGSVVTPQQTINATPTIQAEFFQFMFDQIKTRDEFRAATIFQLNDWSPELARAFSDFLIDEGDVVAAARLEEWLATIGLCRWSDGTCREAYDVFIASLIEMAAIRVD